MMFDLAELQPVRPRHRGCSRGTNRGYSPGTKWHFTFYQHRSLHFTFHALPAQFFTLYILPAQIFTLYTIHFTSIDLYILHFTLYQHNSLHFTFHQHKIFTFYISHAQHRSPLQSCALSVVSIGAAN